MSADNKQETFKSGKCHSCNEYSDYLLVKNQCNENAKLKKSLVTEVLECESCSRHSNNKKCACCLQMTDQYNNTGSIICKTCAANYAGAKSSEWDYETDSYYIKPYSAMQLADLYETASRIYASKTSAGSGLSADAREARNEIIGEEMEKLKEKLAELEDSIDNKKHEHAETYYQTECSCDDLINKLSAEIEDAFADESMSREDRTTVAENLKEKCEYERNRAKRNLESLHDKMTLELKPYETEYEKIKTQIERLVGELGESQSVTGMPEDKFYDFLHRFNTGPSSFLPPKGIYGSDVAKWRERFVGFAYEALENVISPTDGYRDESNYYIEHVLGECISRSGIWSKYFGALNEHLEYLYEISGNTSRSLKVRTSTCSVTNYFETQIQVARLESGEINTKKHVTGGELYSNYADWCKTTARCKPRSNKDFGMLAKAKLAELGGQCGTSSGVKCYRGIQLAA